MGTRELVRYCRELGWTDPPSAPARIPPASWDPVAGCTDLEEVAGFVAGCTCCRLAGGRRTSVFGEGSPRAQVMFIGEGPGVEEDRTGRPFVGQAGQLLDAMIVAMGRSREHVYVANVVKCRPPGNRDPEDDEMHACAAYLDRQIELIAPQVIIALGRVAARRLTSTSKSMGALRGRWSSYRGIPLLPTFHPAYLLRSPAEKRKAWDDLKAVMARLG